MDAATVELAADALHPFLEPYIKSSISKQVEEKVVPTITKFDDKFLMSVDRIESQIAGLTRRCSDDIEDLIEDTLKSQSSLDDWRATEEGRVRMLEKQLAQFEKKAVSQCLLCPLKYR